MIPVLDFTLSDDRPRRNSPRFTAANAFATLEQRRRISYAISRLAAFAVPSSQTLQSLHSVQQATLEGELKKSLPHQLSLMHFQSRERCL